MSQEVRVPSAGHGQGQDGGQFGFRIALALVAAASGILYGLVATIAFSGNVIPSIDSAESWISAPILITILQILVSVLLVIGGIAIFLRRSFGRQLVIIACVLAMTMSVVGFLTAVAFRAGLAVGAGSTAGPAVTIQGLTAAIVYIVPAAMTLALVGLTRFKP